MTYLQCARRECISISPVIDTERDTYYVLGGGGGDGSGATGCINCQACAESRGWHLLRDPVILAQIQRKPRPPPDPDDIGARPTTVTSISGDEEEEEEEEMEVEEWNTALYNQLLPMSVVEFRLFLERGHRRQVMAPETMHRLGELILWMGAQQPPDLHAIAQMMRWWPKLFYDGCPQQLNECYNRCAHQFLTQISEQSGGKPSQQWCAYCGCHVTECVNTLVGHASLLSLLCEENSALWCDICCNNNNSNNTKATTQVEPRALISMNPINHVDFRQDDTTVRPWWWIQQQQHEQQQGGYSETDCLEDVF